VAIPKGKPGPDLHRCHFESSGVHQWIRGRGSNAQGYRSGLGDGTSNKEIGQELHISEATVKSHLGHIFGKLEVDDRTAAVTAALERGILQLGRS